MKKLYFSAFLFFISVLIFCTVGCSSEKNPSDNSKTDAAKTENTQTNTDISPEKAVDIYMAEREVWMYNGESQPLNGYGYCLIDLDLDGVLELITSVCDGSGRYSYNNFYTIDLETQRVKELPQALEQNGESGVDYYYMAKDSKLLKNKSNGTLFYLFSDHVRVGNDEGLLAYSKVYVNDGKVFEETLFSEYWHPDYDNSFAPLFEYFVENESVTSEEYTKASENFYKENEDLKLVWEYVLGSDFSKASDSEQRQLLLDAYNAFTYHKA